MSFSPTHAAFEGFRLIGRRPGAMLLWSLVVLVAAVVLVAGFLALAWPALSTFSDLKDEVLAPADLVRFLAPLGTAFAVVLLLGLLFNGVLYAALYRAVLRPEDGGFGLMKLGGDELRQVAVMLLQFLLGAVLFGVPVAGACLFLFKSGEPDVGAAAGAVAAGLALLLLYVWVSVRLSLAAPLTFVSKRVRFFSSWGVTRRRFWPLVGMYLLAFVFGMIVYYVGSLIADAALAAMGGTSDHHFDTLPELSTALPQLGAGLGVYLVLQIVLSTLQFAITYAPQAAALKALRAERDGV